MVAALVWLMHMVMVQLVLVVFKMDVLDAPPTATVPLARIQMPALMALLDVVVIRTITILATTIHAQVALSVVVLHAIELVIVYFVLLKDRPLVQLLRDVFVKLVFMEMVKLAMIVWELLVVDAILRLVSASNVLISMHLRLVLDNVNAIRTLSVMV